MSTFLMNTFAFLVTIAILVAVHEFGHYWVAKKLGVKVLKFSIGFGKPLFTYTSKSADKTEYILAAIPLGGFVKMLDEREGKVEDHELHRSFNQQVVWKRMAIVFAGPAINFIFAIFAYMLMFMVGISALNPYVGNVDANSPMAIAGFQNQDLVTAVNGEPVATLSDFSVTLLSEYLANPAQINVHVKTEEGRATIRKLDLSALKLFADEGDPLKKMGFNLWGNYFVAFGQPMKDSPADKAGIKANDKLISLNGVPIHGFAEFSAIIKKNEGKTLPIIVSRKDVATGKEKEITLEVTPKTIEIKGESRVMVGIGIGRVSDEATSKRLRTEVSYSAPTAFVEGAKYTWKMTSLSLGVMGKLVTGEASLKNISGPISIANYAGKSLAISLSFFIGFLALISLSLGIMNLLPVPVLDGGHLLFYTIELIKGSPVSEAVEEIGMRIGLAMVGTLMVLAFYNDILRLLK
ncbi:MAG: RIP metalloprotease RseP [Thiotrichaceae bacterium]|nr:RIP metalloprotease RseP [Thiotrichaceae bacterium]